MTRDGAPISGSTDRCVHPARRIFAWIAYDGTLCAGCCECKEVLTGTAEPLADCPNTHHHTHADQREGA